MSRRRGWPRVLIESLAVVASILLAFAIDAWWDRLGERREERESLLVVAADLEASVDQLAAYRDAVDRIAEASVGAYRALSSAVPTSARDSVSDLLVTSTLRRTMSLPRTGYTDLVSTGGLRLIRDRDLRNEIIRFYELVERLEQVAEKNTTTHTDGHLAGVLIREGLMFKRPIRAEATNQGVSDAAIRDRLGVGFSHRPDPIWSFTPDSREWDRVRSALLQNGRGTQTAVSAADRLHSAAIALYESIDAHLSDGDL